MRKVHSPKELAGRSAPFTADTQIIYRERSFPAKIRQLSAEGVYLQTEALTVPRRMPVEIAFSLGRRQWHVAGFISHNSPKGLGIMFRTRQPELQALASKLFPEGDIILSFQIQAADNRYLLRPPAARPIL